MKGIIFILLLLISMECAGQLLCPPCIGVTDNVTPNLSGTELANWDAKSQNDIHVITEAQYNAIAADLDNATRFNSNSDDAFAQTNTAFNYDDNRTYLINDPLAIPAGNYPIIFKVRHALTSSTTSVLGVKFKYGASNTALSSSLEDFIPSNGLTTTHYIIVRSNINLPSGGYAGIYLPDGNSGTLGIIRGGSAGSSTDVLFAAGDATSATSTINSSSYIALDGYSVPNVQWPQN